MTLEEANNHPTYREALVIMYKVIGWSTLLFIGAAISCGLFMTI